MLHTKQKFINLIQFNSTNNNGLKGFHSSACFLREKPRPGTTPSQLRTKKGKRAVAKSGGRETERLIEKRFVKIFVMLILIIIFFVFDGIYLIYYIKDLINDYSYLKKLLLFIILIPTIINGITLYLLYKIEKKKKSEGDISNHKLLPNVLKNYITYLIKVVNNKELFSFYSRRGERCHTELVFYVIILIMYNIILMFVM